MSGRATGVLIAMCLAASNAQAAPNCSTESLAHYREQIQTGKQNSDWYTARLATQLLSDCFPQRGDLRVDLLRYSLLLRDYPSAQQEYEWLQQQSLPPALERIINTWMHELPDNTAKQLIAKRWSSRLTLSGGYNSNANDGSQHLLVPVNLGGLSLLWRLDDDSTEQASRFVRTEARVSHSSGKSVINTAFEFTQYTELNEHDADISLAYARPYDCSFMGQCRFNTLINAREEFGSKRYQGLIGTSVSTSTQLWNTYYRYSHDPEGIDSNSLGIQSSQLVLPQFLLYGGIEYDWADQPRAGGDRAQLHVGTRWRPFANSSFQLTLLHLMEQDQEAWSPGLWGDKKRNRRFSSLGMEYQWNLAPKWSLKLEGSYRQTGSPLKLYQQSGWILGVSLTRQD